MRRNQKFIRIEGRSKLRPATYLLFENTYPCVIIPEPKKGQLEVKIFVDLRHGIVDVRLVVAVAVIAALVIETVQEFAPDLLESSLSDDVDILMRSNLVGRRCKSVVFAV